MRPSIGRGAFLPATQEGISPPGSWADNRPLVDTSNTSTPDSMSTCSTPVPAGKEDAGEKVSPSPGGNRSDPEASPPRLESAALLQKLETLNPKYLLYLMNHHPWTQCDWPSPLFVVFLVLALDRDVVKARLPKGLRGQATSLEKNMGKALHAKTERGAARPHLPKAAATKYATMCSEEERHYLRKNAFPQRKGQQPPVDLDHLLQWNTTDSAGPYSTQQRSLSVGHLPLHRRPK